MNGKEFVEDFLKLFEKNSESYKEAVDKYKKNAEYTKFITQKTQDIFERYDFKKKDFGKENYRIDISAWIRRDKEESGLFKKGLWELEVAVEHENTTKDWRYEVKKLLHIKCPLRVVIGYMPKTKREDDLSYLKEVYKQIKQLNVFKNNNFENDEFIVILGNGGSVNDESEFFNYKAYRLFDDGFKAM